MFVNEIWCLVSTLVDNGLFPDTQLKANVISRCLEKAGAEGRVGGHLAALSDVVGNKFTCHGSMTGKVTSLA